MILDLPPHIEQVIIARAEQRGLTLEQMLSADYVDDLALLADQAGIVTDTDNTVLTDEQWQFVISILDNPPPKTQAMQKLLALREVYV